MVGTTVTFTKKVASGTDDLNNPTYTDTPVAVDDCLIAPITEPASKLWIKAGIRSGCICLSSALQMLADQPLFMMVKPLQLIVIAWCLWMAIRQRAGIGTLERSV